MNELVQEQLKDVEAQFNRLTSEIEQIQGKVNEGNRQIASRKEELIRLQGSYKTLKELESSKEEPKKEAPKTKKK